MPLKISQSHYIPRTVRRVIPFAFVAVAFVLQLQFHELIGNRSFLLLYPAVFLGSLFGTFRTSVSATVLATLLAWYFFVPARYSFEIHAQDALAASIFFLTCLISNFLGQQFEARTVSEAQAKVFDTALSSTPDFHFLVDRDHRFTYVNQSLLRLWDSSLDRVVGKKFEDIGGYSSALVQRYEAHLSEAFQGHPTKGETQHTFPQNYNGVYEYVFTPVLDASGSVQMVAGTTRDITERKRIEEERLRQQRMDFLLQQSKQSEEALRHSIVMRDEFMSVASHELKTPITSLKLQLEIIQRAMQENNSKALAPERLERALSVQMRQVDRLKNLVDELLDVSRIQEGKIELSLSTFEMTPLVQEVVDRFATELKSTGSIGQVIAENAATVRADRSRMDQVLTNLITNAIKYGNGKPIEVRVEQTDSHTRVLVKDRGIGIPAEKISKVFDRFERAVSSRNISGLGLGLYIAQEIVRAHRGTIEVKSEVGKGSTFIASIPHPFISMN